MEHTEFVDACKNGTRKIYVTRSKALQAVTNGFLPKRYQFAHIFWSWIWFLSILAGIAIMIFQKWWIGLIFLVCVPGTISAAVKKSAFDFVIEHAIEDPKFYIFAISNGIITIE
ncbi:MAG: hypothetical protein NTW44_04245 [Nitrospirae bacterium]|nr:hypothetical protein [Nitrospirota bacterium]